MADTDETKKRAQEGSIHGVDPDVVAKVDKMMSYSKDAKDDSQPSGAPLLPSDKLPDFSKDKPSVKQQKEEKPADSPEVKAEYKPAAKPEPAPMQVPAAVAEDNETAKAVDDIAREESNRMLAIEDAKAELLAEGTAEIDKGWFNRVKTVLGNFWHNKKARNLTLAGLLLLIAVAGVVPASRYFILNTAGVRSSMSVRIIDDKTEQPLKNVDVSVDNRSAKTDIDGKVKLTNIKLGKQHLSVKKPAFADVNQDVVIGWGSNPRGDVGLTPVGSRYTFEIKDYVSGKPVKEAEAVSGEASATANDGGEIVLVAADQNESEINIHISAPNYRAEDITLDVGNKDTHQISLVPARKHAFVSKRNGKYDLYKTDIDGKNEKLVLAGTGAESEDNTVIVPSPNSDTIAYVTTRGDKHNDDGFALSSLIMVNLDEDKTETIDYSERVQLVDFIGNKLVYVKIAQGQSAASLDRHQLISYDINTKEQKIIYKTNYFNDVLSAKGAVYFAPSKYKTDSPAGLFKINPDGSGQSAVYGQEVWNLYRVAYDKINAAVGENWYEYDIGQNTFNALNGAPADQQSRVYADSPDGKQSAWVDKRDGKGVLIIYDTLTGQDSVIQTQSGLTNPISWLDNEHLVYRVDNNSETADYVIGINGGTPKKISDVTNTAGLDRWYYY
jgi:Tol biopolymer transport system component